MLRNIMKVLRVCVYHIRNLKSQFEIINILFSTLKSHISLIFNSLEFFAVGQVIE